MKEQYQNAMQQITAPEALKQRTLQQMSRQFQQKPGRRTGRWKLPVAAVICGVCLLGAVPVMAAHVPMVAAVLEQISPELARMLTPVELSCTDNGIRMQVDAVAQSKEEILAYLTIQDLEGDRVDETTDLYNYVIDGYRAFTHRIVSYDPEQKKALLELRAHHGDITAPKKTVVQVTSFLSKEQVYENIPVAIPDIIQEKTTEPKTMQVTSMGGGGDLLEKIATNEGLWKIRVLKPGEKQALRDDIDFVSITGIGYVDDRLHIQTWWACRLSIITAISPHIPPTGKRYMPPMRIFIWMRTARRFRLIVKMPTDSSILNTYLIFRRRNWPNISSQPPYLPIIVIPKATGRSALQPIVCAASRFVKKIGPTCRKASSRLSFRL